MTDINLTGNQILYDRTTTSGAIYIGEASCGIATSVEKWAIRKVALDGDGKPTSIKWAGGTVSHVNEWDERANLEYS